MDRRGFLGVLAGAALDPERALWVPGRKLISIPPPRVYRSGAEIMAMFRADLMAAFPEEHERHVREIRRLILTL